MGLEQFEALIPIKIADGTDRFELRTLSAVTNLVDEYGIIIEEGDNFQVTMPANWDPNDFSIGVWAPVDFSSVDGLSHFLFVAAKDASNYVSVWKSSANDLRARLRIAGVSTTATIAGSWSAGDVIYVGLQFDGTTLTLHFDNDADNVLETDTQTPGATFASASGWTGYIGQDNDTAFRLEGSLNLLLTNDGSDASAITDRFNSGAGLAFGGDMGWAAQVSGNGSRHGENLVLSVGGNADGSAYELNTASGATDLLAGTATGRVDVSSGNYLTTADPGAAADGIAAASWGFAFESDEVANSIDVLGRWGGSDNQFLIRRRGATSFRVHVASSGSDASNYADFTVSLAASTSYKGIVTYSAGTIALYYKAMDGATRKYGAQSAPAPAVTGSIPATLRACSVGYKWGGIAFINDALNGKIDDIRIWNGKALTSAEADADLINEPNPAGLSHWWPFDGDGTDVIGGLTASWTGTPAYADDGRHDLGRFERYTKSGQYYTDGVDDKITHGNYAALDGASKAKVQHIYTPGVTPTVLDRYLFGRGLVGTQGQISALRTSTNGLIVYVAGSAAGAEYGRWDSFFSDGVPVDYDVEFDGSQSTNATRLVVKKSTRDPATGTWSTKAAVTASAFNGTIPATLRTPSSNTTLTVGVDPSATSGRFAQGLHDRFACHAGSIPASFSPYASGAASYDIWCDYNGNANNAGLAATAEDRYAFARADTATYVDVNGVVQPAASGVLRDKHYLTDNTDTFRRVTLLERAYNANLVTSDNFDSGWTSVGTPVVTSGIDDPAGGTSAYRIADDSGAVYEYKYHTVGFTGDGTKAIVFVVREAASTSTHVLGVSDTTAAAYRLRLDITWTNGEPQVAETTGSLLLKRELGNGWWVLYGQAPGVVAANNNRLQIEPTSGGAAQTASIDVFRVMAFDAAVPPASILSASEVTTSDDFTVDLLDATPQEATYLYEGVVLDLPNQGTARAVFSVGAATGTNAHLQVYMPASASRLYVNFRNASATVSGYWNVALALGDYIAVRLYQTSAGAITARLTINSAAEVGLDGAIGEQALPGSWANAAVSFSRSAAGSGLANSGLISFKAQSGAEKTLAQMQALTSADIAYWYTGQQLTNITTGTVTGAIQWYDGRQPEGWTVVDLEVDRAVSATNCSEGTYGLRVKALSASGNALRSTVGLTAGRWVLYVSSGREVTAPAFLRVGGSAFGSSPSAEVPTQASLATVGRAARVVASATGVIELRLPSPAEAYFDNLRALQLATVSASIAAKQVPSRVIFSFSDPGNPSPYVLMALSNTEYLEGWAKNDDDTQFGPAGGDTHLDAGWHTVGFGYDGVNLFVTIDGEKEATLVQPTGTFNNLSETTIGALRVSVDSHFLGMLENTELGRILIWSIPLTDTERAAAHNILRRVYYLLPEAS